MSLDPALRQRIQTLLDGHRVVLFMKGEADTPQCGFSAQAAGVLHSLAVPFLAVNVLADPEIREGIKQYGDWPTIPQLYVGGELVGGSDIIVQMAGSGELQQLLGLPAPDRTPPVLHITPAAQVMLKQAMGDAEMAVEIAIDPSFRHRLHLVPLDDAAVQVRVQDIIVQIPLTDLRRADGLTLDFVDDERGKGLRIDNPNAPAPVRDISPAEAAARVAAGELTLVDVRPQAERALASAPLPFLDLDAGVDALAHLDKQRPIAFLCHHGGRSRQAAEHFRAQGFREVFNVAGGIDAWADIAPDIPRY